MSMRIRVGVSSLQVVFCAISMATNYRCIVILETVVHERMRAVARSPRDRATVIAEELPAVLVAQ